MATIETTQDGPLTTGSTYSGGAAPSDGDTVNIYHAVTVEANFTQAATSLVLGKSDWDQYGTLDTRNAADSTNYNLTVKKINMTGYNTENNWDSNGVMNTVNFRNGTHTLQNDNADGLYINQTFSHTYMEDGCTLNLSGFQLKGRATFTGYNTINVGYNADVSLDGYMYFYGGGESGSVGDDVQEAGEDAKYAYNGTNTWETMLGRTKFILDQSARTSDEDMKFYFNMSSGALDDDGPLVIKFREISIDNCGKKLEFQRSSTTSEWSYTNSCTIDVGGGGFGQTNEGNVTIVDGKILLSTSNHTGQGAGYAFRCRGNMTIGDGGTTTGEFRSGPYTSSYERFAYIRIDGNLNLNGGSEGSNKAGFHMPCYGRLVEDSASAHAAYSINGFVYIAGSITFNGRINYYGPASTALTDGGIAGKDWVLLHDNGGTAKFYIGKGDSASSPAYFYGNTTSDSSGQFTYGQIEEMAIHEYHPSGISLATKPDSGSKHLQVSSVGDDNGANLIFDENAAFDNITIDANCTITCNPTIEVTYSGSLTNNGSLGTDTSDDGSKIHNPGETKSHASFGRGDGGKTSFTLEAINDLDQPNWVENYFLDQDNRLG